MSQSEDGTPKMRAYLDLTPSNAQNAEDQAEAAAIAARSTPKFEQLKARELRLAARGSPAIVLVDGAMPSGVLAQIALGQSGPLSRYVVLSASDLRDAVVDQALGLVHRWETENVDDEGPMTATLFTDGRYAAKSNGRGAHSGVYRPRRIGGSQTNSELMSTDLRRRADLTEPQNVPGIGMARVIVLKLK